MIQCRVSLPHSSPFHGYFLTCDWILQTVVHSFYLYQTCALLILSRIFFSFDPRNYYCNSSNLFYKSHRFVLYVLFYLYLFLNLFKVFGTENEMLYPNFFINGRKLSEINLTYGMVKKFIWFNCKR